MPYSPSGNTTYRRRWLPSSPPLRGCSPPLIRRRGFFESAYTRGCGRLIARVASTSISSKVDKSRLHCARSGSNYRLTTRSYPGCAGRRDRTRPRPRPRLRNVLNECSSGSKDLGSWIPDYRAAIRSPDHEWINVI